MKFKNTPKKKYKKAKDKSTDRLPSDSRIITDKINSDDMAFFIGFLCIFGAILIISFSLYGNFKEERRISLEKIKINNEINYWRNQIEQRPDFRDAYFSLSLLSYQLGDFNESRLNLEKTLKIDPNFEKALEFRKILAQ